MCAHFLRFGAKSSVTFLRSFAASLRLRVYEFANDVCAVVDTGVCTCGALSSLSVPACAVHHLLMRFITAHSCPRAAPTSDKGTPTTRISEYKLDCSCVDLVSHSVRELAELQLRVAMGVAVSVSAHRRRGDRYCNASRAQGMRARACVCLWVWVYVVLRVD